MLQGLKYVVLGITGCIAAYKSAHLVRLLVQAGIEVKVVMTDAAEHFVGAATFQALSGHPVYTSLWDTRIDNQMVHIELARWADLILIAPATADVMAKLAHGHADCLLTTLCLARDIPLWIAPAMNRQMWNQPATQRNVKQLQADGIRILGPASGSQACGEEGEGRMLEPDDLFAALEGFGMPAALFGKKVVITAGPTFEAIDTVRGLTNQSSGKMGFAIAQAAVQAGAHDVILISGPVTRPTPSGVNRINVVNARQMLEAVHHAIEGSHYFFSVAAVTDYRVEQPLTRKLKRETQEGMTTHWIANPDILASVAQLPHAPFCVGFAAESESMLENAQLKRQRKGVPLLVANQVQDAMMQDDNTLLLLDEQGIHSLPRAPKTHLARQLILHTVQLQHFLSQKQSSL